MRAVMLDVPAHLLAERHRVGADRRDEMWEGELHLVPLLMDEDTRLNMELLTTMRPLALDHGVEMYFHFGLFEPDVPGHESYRVPDLVVFHPSVSTRRGVEGAAELVIEIASPGDESLAKLPYYERVGVKEVLIVDRDTKALRHWLRSGVRLVETEPGPVSLSCLPVTLSTAGDRLHVKTPTDSRSI